MLQLKMLLVAVSFATLLFSSVYAQEVPADPTDISPLLIGEKIPESMVKDPDGNARSLLEEIGKKPTVLIFYRGGWCPYCNKHLAELQAVEQDILDMGYQILAVSPDAPEQLKTTVDKNELTYRLFSDSDLKVTKEFGLAFQAPDRYKKMLFNASAEQNPGELPVPAVFVLNQEGTILFEYINPNYDSRMSGKMLTAVLGSLED
ncbi:AhpC/TSA family protein [Echinicola soli]|uniref:thioredoxin-dependent peroxiredoxin n=1 Tax=Echinicola soli TaxID=2591634 RepID=A0A514CFQ4_9BACT|nr:peroxiredoxin-like family protein [Echinicola soli]QDH78649.1 AhpC/TSA family protein [Echinicola soli]